MPSVRRKSSAVLREFLHELHRLERFDSDNQKKLSEAGYKAGRLSKRQLHLLTESIFFAAFRSYEGFVRDVFLLCCLGVPTGGKHRVVSYLQPRNFSHASQLLQSAMPHLDWTSPDIVLQRAETYLKDGNPFKLPYSTNLEALRDCKRLRNHIAHNSSESMEEYKKVVQRHYKTLPLVIPSPGEFLVLPDITQPGKYKLLSFLDLLRQLASDIC